MFKACDVFPKFSDRSARLHTFSGGIITIIITSWIIFLISGEIKSFVQTHIDSSIIIDNDPIQGPRKVYIDFDMTVQASCTLFHLDLFESDGTVKTDIIENVTRSRLDSTGTPIETAMERRFRSGNYKKVDHPQNYCGSCFGALPNDKCCNTCHDLMAAFKQKGWGFIGVERYEQCVKEGYTDFGQEKCHVKGSLKVRRGTGHFHFGLGANQLSSNKGHNHDLLGLPRNVSLSHTIDSFKIGPELPDFQSPLQNIDVEIPVENGNFWIVAYFLHIVPSKWTSKKKTIESYRYSAMYSQRTMVNGSKKGLPGIHFYYDFSPMMVTTSKSKTSVRTFVTHIGGIIGGAFSFAAIIDALMFSALSTVKGKASINKIA